MQSEAVLLERTPLTLDGAIAAKQAVVNVLAYVHLRNIHASTGAGRTARQIVEHLTLRDDVRIRILADAADKDRILPLVKEPWTRYDYKTFTSDTSRQQARWFLLNSPAAETFWPEADVVFCTGESYVPVRKARLVVTAHDAGYFEPDAHIRDTHYWKTRAKWELLYKKLIAKVDIIHTVSAFSAGRLAHFFPEIKSRIRWVHNGVTPHFFQPVSEEGHNFLRENGLADRPFVLVPGGLHFRKNAELILEGVPMLLKQHPDLIVAVVNHTNPAYTEQAEMFAPRLRFLGFVSDAALHALYTAATVVWYPSRYEGFGLPVVEAMACGASVVASNSSSIPEIAGDAAMLVDPTSARAHVDAITSLLTDPRAREQCATAGRTRAAGFTWAACAGRLTQVFHALL